MGRSLNEIIASLPRDQQEQIEARHEELIQEVEGLRELRQIAGKAQEDVATALNIKQPSVSKIEKQADMYLSTLRNYVEAVGGSLELVVTLPSRAAVRLHSLGDIHPLEAPSKQGSPRHPRRAAGRKLNSRAG